MKKNNMICLTAFFMCILIPTWTFASNIEPLSVSEAVLEAIENNPLVQQAKANIEAAGESIKSARADMLPQATAGYGYTSLKEKPVMDERSCL